MTVLNRRFPRLREFAPLLTVRRPEFNGTDRRLARAQTIDDLRQIAKRRTPAGPFDYTDGSADDEVTAARTRQSFLDVEFQPQVMRDVSSIDTTCAVFGKTFALPFGLGPTGFTRMMHSAGERAVVSAAAAAGIPYTLSTVGTTSIQGVADEAPDAHRWFQLYPLRDRDLSLRLITEASEAGYEVLVITVDVPIAGNRLRDVRNGMTIPPQLTLRTFLNASYRPAWWWNFLTTERFSFAFEQSGSEGFGLGNLVSTLYDPSMTFDDLAWVREAWHGPIVIKGIQTERDAARAVDFGADGLVLSNHGGRQLDRAPVPLHLLPSVSRRHSPEVTIMLDSGVRSGADVVAALALGADFVLLGRAYLYGLMAGGEAGVSRAIAIMRSEVERTMALLGATRIADLDGEFILDTSSDHEKETT